jgi:hypothetical protein
MRLPEFSKIREQENTLADQLNRLERTNYRGTLYDVGIERGGMGYGGPLWADIKETFSDTLTGYLQIVGHTRVEEIRTTATKTDQLPIATSYQRESSFIKSTYSNLTDQV